MNSDRDKSRQYHQLAAFIAENNFGHGAKIGAGMGECMAICLEHNPQLRFLGMDTWDDVDGDDSEQLCRTRCAPYKERVTLLKGDAAIIGKGFPSKIFDFAFYWSNGDRDDAYYERVLKLWMHKIKPGGYLISNFLDRAEIRIVLAKLGYETISPLDLLKRDSNTGLHYIQLN